MRDACLCLHVQRAARALARRFDDGAAAARSDARTVLAADVAQSPGTAELGSVAALLAMDRTTLTANLKPLERRHLVKIAIDKEDKRSRRLTITAAGRALLGKAFPVWKKAHAETERLV